MVSASPSNPSQPGKKDRREAARETARIEREAEKRRQRRNRFYLQGGIGVVIIAIVVIGILIFAGSGTPTQTGAGPANMASDGILFTGQNGAVVPTETAALSASAKPIPTKTASTAGVAHIVTYVDWSCPACKSFEATYASDISALVASGSATLEVHPIAILDTHYLTSKYSTRAANAAACVANYAPTKFLAAQTVVYDKQPTENTSGLTNAGILALLKSAGVDSSKITSCVNSGKFESWVAKVTDRTTSTASLVDTTQGGFTTPTVVVNGKRWDNSGDFGAFVASAAGLSTATPSPTPTP